MAKVEEEVCAGGEDSFIKGKIGAVQTDRIAHTQQKVHPRHLLLIKRKIVRRPKCPVKLLYRAFFLHRFPKLRVVANCRIAGSKAKRSPAAGLLGNGMA